MAVLAQTAGTQAQTVAPGGAPKAPFPPFNQDTFGSQLLWLAICFVALYVLLARVALPRVGSIFAARAGTIEGDIAAAGRLKAESDTAIEAYEKALSEARAKAQAIASATRAEFAARTDEKKTRLDAELADRLGAAEKQIEATKKAAMANVRAIAADTAAEIVKRLTGEAPKPQLLDRAIDRALH
jgi:F-type H+-transporting ATPase subunit b